MTQHYLPPAPLNAPAGSLAWAEWYRLMRQVAESGQTAYILVNDPTTGLQGKLNSDAADTLNGTISFGTLGAFKVGTVTWNGTSATGTGVMFTQNGIVGASSGTVKFVIKSDGTATFGGDLTAATGTFAGDISSGGGIYTTGYSNNSITINGTAYDPSIFGAVTTTLGSNVPVGLLGYCSVNSGGQGVVASSSGAAISTFTPLFGISTHAESSNTNGLVRGIDASSGNGRGSIAVRAFAQNNATGTSKTVTAVDASSNTTNSSTLNYGLAIAQSGGSSSSAGILVSSDTGTALRISSGGIRLDDTSFVGTGASTGTYVGTNKPGSNSNNTWLKININGTDYYIPIWT